MGRTKKQNQKLRDGHPMMVRLPIEVYRKLKELAEAEDRKVSAYARVVLRDHTLEYDNYKTNVGQD